MNTGDGAFRELFLTVHALGAPFTDFPGYQAIEKTKPGTSVVATTGEARVNPWTKGKPGRAIRIESANGLQFATRELRAAPGERLSLTFTNPDAVPHNWVLLKPGTIDKTGDLANKLISDPAGPARHYVPDSPDVLVWTDMVPAAGESTIHFNAPRHREIILTSAPSPATG